jgi:hypothetical protein
MEELDWLGHMITMDQTRVGKTFLRVREKVEAK